MAAPLPTIDLGGLDPAQIRDLNRELANTANIEASVRLPLKQLGGAFGRLNNALRKGAESTILLAKLSEDPVIQKLAISMEESLMSTLSFMERSAFRAKQQLKLEIEKQTDSERQRSQLLGDAAQKRIDIEKKTLEEIKVLETRIAETKRNVSNQSNDVVQRSVENIRQEISIKEKYIEIQKKSIDSEIESIKKNQLVSDKLSTNFRILLQRFDEAFTDEQRELAQQRLAGQIAGEKQALKILEERYTKEQEILRTQSTEISKIVDSKERERKQFEITARTASIKTLEKEIETLKKDTASREIAIAKTTEQYKQGLRGFAGELVSKSFTGGLFGAMRGEGFGDLFTNLAKMTLERSGVLQKKMPKILGGGNVGAFLYGSQSEEARKASAFTAEQIKATGPLINLINDLNTTLKEQNITTLAAEFKTFQQKSNATLDSIRMSVDKSKEAVSESENTISELQKTLVEKQTIAQQTMQEAASAPDEEKNAKQKIANAAAEEVRKTEEMLSIARIDLEKRQKISSFVEEEYTRATETKDKAIFTRSSVDKSMEAMNTSAQTVESAIKNIADTTAMTFISDVSETKKKTKKTATERSLSTEGADKKESVSTATTFDTLNQTTQKLAISQDNLSQKTDSTSASEVVRSIRTDEVSTKEQNLSETTRESTEKIDVLKTNVESTNLALDQQNIIIDINIDSQKKSTEEVNKTSNALDSLTKKIDETASSMSSIRKTAESSSTSETTEIKNLKSSAEDISKVISETKDSISNTKDSFGLTKKIVDSTNLSLDSSKVQTENLSQSQIDLKTTTESSTSGLESLKTSSESSVSGLESLKTSSESSVSGLESLKITTESSTSGLESLKTSSESSVSGLESLKITTESSTSGLESLKTSSESSVSGLESLKTSSESSVSGLESLKTSSESSVSGLESLKTSSESSVSGLESLKTSSESSVSGLESLKTSSESSVSGLESLKTSSESSVSGLESLKTSSESSVSGLESLKITTESSTSGLESLKTSSESSVSGLESLKTSSESSVSGLESLKTSSESSVSGLESLKTSSESTDSSLKSLEIKTEKINQTQDSLKQTIENLDASMSSNIEANNETSNKQTNIVDSIEESAKISTESLSTAFIDLTKKVSDINLSLERTTQTSDSLSVSEDRLKTSTESVDTSKQGLEKTVTVTDQSLINLNTNVDSLISSVENIISRSSEEGIESLEEEKSLSSSDIKETISKLMAEENGLKESANLDTLIQSSEISSNELKTISEISRAEQSVEANKLSTVSVSDDQLRTNSQQNTSISESILKAALETSTSIKSISETKQSMDTLLPPGEQRIPKLDEFIPIAPVQEQGYTSMIELRDKALERGSIYTHDIYSEQILSSIFGIMQRDSQSVSSSEQNIKETAQTLKNIETQSTVTSDELSEIKKETESKIEDKNIFTRAKENILGSVNKRIESTINSVKSTRERIKTAVGSVKGRLGGVITRVGGATTGIVGGAAKMLSSTFSKTMDFSSNIAKNASEKISKGITIVKETAGRGYEIAKDAVGGFVRSPKEKISKAVSTVASSVSSIFQGRSRESSTTNNSFLKLAKEKMSKSFQSVTQFFTKPRGTVGGILTTTKQGISKAFNRVSNLFGGKSTTVEGAKKGGIVNTVKSLFFGEKEADGKSTDTALYTHDTFVEKILTDIFDLFNSKSSSSASKEGGGKKSGIREGGGLGGGGVGFGKFKGIAQFFNSVATGIKSFASPKIFVGALGLAAVGASVIPFAYGMTILADVPWQNILFASAAMIGFAFVTKMLGKMATDVLKGSLLLGLIGVAIIPAMYAFSLLADINPATILAATAAIVGISAIAVGIGLIAATGVGAAAIALGAGLLALIGVAMIPLANGLQLLGQVDPSKLLALSGALFALIPSLLAIALFSPLLLVGGYALGMIGLAMLPLSYAINSLNEKKTTVFANLINSLAESSGKLMKAALAIGLTAIGVTALGAAIGFATLAVAATQVASVIGSFFGFGKVSILDQIFGMAAMSDKLMETAVALTMIAEAISSIGEAFANIEGSEGALETIDELVSMDATQIQTLQDVSLAMDRVMNANQKLKEEKQLETATAAAMAGGGGGLGGTNAIVATNSFGTSNFYAAPKSRNADPSILFSGERYYSMIYR